MTPTDTVPSPSHEDQLRKLYLDQKQTLDLFMERGAISRAQYDKSLGELTARLGMEKQNDP